MLRMSLFSVDIQTQCQTHSDCDDVQLCYQGSCQNACRFEACGLNAKCSAKQHTAHCTCIVGYTGDPHIACSRRMYNNYSLCSKTCTFSF